MFDQLFDTLHKASESSLKAQQDMFRHWAAQWPAGAPNAAGAPGQWNEAVHKRWLESATEALNKHRELLDSMYRSGISVIEQTFRTGTAKSPEEYHRLFEELWSKLSETFKAQSEAQFREFQKAAETWSAAAPPKAKV